MEFSDDEAEAEISAVSNYEFKDDSGEPVSFAELSVRWSEAECLDGTKRHVFLLGDADNGNMKVYEEVTAWKFDLSSVTPDVWVLNKKGSWILLLKPRKAFQDTIIRTILVTLQCLRFFRKNPDSSFKALWEHLHKVLRLEPRPSENDLVDHIDFISEAIKRDNTLAKAKVLVTFLKEGPGKRIILNEVNNKTLSGFIVDDDLGDETFEDASDEEEDDQFESVCAICDNGGEIICCEGKCLRSFHATEEDGQESYCESLGFTRDQVNAVQKFYCQNCKYQKHQCFACGELGSSDTSSGAEVFRCINATCGRFYHPRCVAKLLKRENQTNVDDRQKKIAAGEPFACPMHQCFVCNQIEDKDIKDLQFAICRRCPRAYHRKCLPREISFGDEEDVDQRAWDDLIPNRILIYCLEHEIDEELCTPARNHLKFPGVMKKKIKKKSEMLEKKKTVREDSDPMKQKRIVAMQSKDLQKLPTGVVGVSSKKREGRLLPPNSSKKRRVMDTSRKSLEKSSSLAKQDRPVAAEGKVSLGQMLFDKLTCNDAEPVESDEVAEDLSAAKKETSNSVILDADSKKRILSIMEDSSSITLEKVLRKRKVPTERAYSSNFSVDKSITLGKVEGSIKAIRAALQKLEEGGSVDDAKTICDPALLPQIMKWKNKLKVYLAPFLYGTRYTSFGRHFTQVDKLREIVDMLHWYVEDGDTIVDFCCGSNDFSCLMKNKMDEVGKSCSFKNFDILQPKNDFCFEKRDWMTVQSKELPPGSKLIMGLNPPFGVNATLANKFINKALEFKPKLLILIVPQETQRLDEKRNPYDLIWENDELLSGKAFYLPGSVDVNDKTLEDWNVSTPPLYLWSRPDWTKKHKNIAEQYGHLSKAYKNQGEDQGEKLIPGDDLGFHDCQVESSNKPELTKSQRDVTEPLKEQLSRNSNAVEVQNDGCSGAKQSEEIENQRESPDVKVANKSTMKNSLLSKTKPKPKPKAKPKPSMSRDKVMEGKSVEKRSLPRDPSPVNSGARSIQTEEKSHGKLTASLDPSLGEVNSLQSQPNSSSMSTDKMSEGKSTEKKSSLPRDPSPVKSGGRTMQAEDKSQGKATASGEVSSLQSQPKPSMSGDKLREGKSTEKRSLPCDPSPVESGGRSMKAEDKSQGKAIASLDPSSGEVRNLEAKAEDKSTGKRTGNSSSGRKGHIKSPPRSTTNERSSHTEAVRQDNRRGSRLRAEAEDRHSGRRMRHSSSPGKGPIKSSSTSMARERPFRAEAGREDNRQSNYGRNRSFPSSRHQEMPSPIPAGADDYGHFSGNRGSASQGHMHIPFGAQSDDDLVNKYLPTGPDPYSSTANRWHDIPSPRAAEYGIRAPDDHFLGTDIPPYGFNRMDEHVRRLDMHGHGQFYGQQGHDYSRQPSPNIIGSNHGLRPMYGQHPLDNDPTYGLQHPPRMYDAQHSRLSPGYDPHLAGGSGRFVGGNPRPPGHNTLSFAQGPYHPLPHNSSGWLNE